MFRDVEMHEETSIAEVNRRAWEVLVRELGITDTVRFVQQFAPDLGNYIEIRRSLFDGYDLARLIDEISQFVSAKQSP
jgi:hypothetical protein